MNEDIDERLDKVIARINRSLDAQLTIVDDFFFIEDEENAWFKSEPNFTKRIVTPLDSNPHQTKKRHFLSSGAVKFSVVRPFDFHC